MRASLRVGGTLGALGSVALCVLQLGIGLAVVPVIVLAGLLAGLGVAKWLERPRYGRQLEEGAWAGIFAAGFSGIGALLSLLALGPHDLQTLSARSHVGGLSLAPTIQQFSSLGWAGLDVLSVLIAVASGILLAALTARIVGWSKSAHAANTVRLARLAALAFQKADSWEQAPFATGTLASMSRGRVTAAPVSTVTAGPASSGKRTKQSVGVATAERDAELLLTPEDSSKRTAGRRRTSDARPVGRTMSDEMRKALEAWAEQNPEEEAAEPQAPRTPALSTYLNSPAPTPAPKRNRKKNPTRDWIC